MRQLLQLTGEPLSDGLVTDKTSTPEVRVTFGKSLIDSAQVQVDSIIQVDSSKPTVELTGRQHRADKMSLSNFPATLRK